MYNDEIYELKQEKKEALNIFYKDYINIYIKLLIGYPNLKKERNILKYLYKQYIKFDNNETEVLNLISKIHGNKENIDLIDNLLDEFDKIFENYYDYLSECLYGYESTINDDIINIIINRIKGDYLKIDNERYRMKLPKIGKTFNNEYKEKILKQIRSI